MGSLILYLVIITAIFLIICCRARDPFKLLGGALFYALWGIFCLYLGKIPDRGSGTFDITGPYFTVAVTVTFILAALFMVKFIIALRTQAPSLTMELLKLLRQ